MNEFAPYINVSKELISKKRHFAGTMFMHQMETFSILLNYHYTDKVLLKAALIHDVIEDIPNFDQSQILTIDSDANAVLDIVKMEKETLSAWIFQTIGVWMRMGENIVHKR